jgi:alpha-tubulin suppressor-like RCC1 family protein
LWCWGGLSNVNSGSDRDIGNGTDTGSALPVQIGSEDDWISVGGLGGGHTCALRADGTAWCWGSNSQLALGDNPLADSLVPARVAG